MEAPGHARSRVATEAQSTKGSHYQRNKICFVIVKQSDPHNTKSDAFWDEPIIGKYCTREDAVAGKDTDTIITVKGLSAGYIEDFILRNDISDNAILHEVVETLFSVEIPFSTLDRDIGYYFVKFNKLNEKELRGIFAKANKDCNTKYSIHQLHVLKSGWFLAIMSADSLHDYNDFMQNYLYKEVTRTIESSYLLGVLKLIPRGKEGLHADVLSDFKRVLEETAGSVHPYIVSVLLEKDAKEVELVKEVIQSARGKKRGKKDIGKSRSQVYKAIQGLRGKRIIEIDKNDICSLDKEKLGSLYGYARSR